MTIELVPAKPTPGQLHAFATYIRLGGSQKEAAYSLGIAVTTMKNHMSKLYARLDVGSAMEAAVKLGWVHLPNDEGSVMCSWIGYCSRPLGHRGHHGGFRMLVKLHPLNEGGVTN